MKIMIVEDDIDINNLLKELLSEEGYELTQCFTAREALLMEISEFDLILLDLMMPFMSGEEFIKEVRERKMSIPIIVLSAKIDKETRIGVLKDGADDFITKPFDFDDVLARVEANIRRYRDFTKEIKKLEVKDLKYNYEEECFYLFDEPLKLTMVESKILKLFLENPKKIFTKKNIYEAVWEDYFAADEDIINAHISNIRRKIKNKTKEEYIETLWGIGYRLNKDLNL